MIIYIKCALSEPCDYKMLPIEVNIVKSKSKPEILNKRIVSKIVHDTFPTIKATRQTVQYRNLIFLGAAKRQIHFHNPISSL